MTHDEKEARAWLTENGLNLRSAGTLTIREGGKVLGAGVDIPAAVVDAMIRDPQMPAARAQLLFMVAAISLGADAVHALFEDEDADDEDSGEDTDDEDSENRPMRIRRA